jgi:hypothetical protein
MHMETRIVGTVAMLVGLALLVLPLILQQRLPGRLEELALVASGLVMSVFGVALSRADDEPRRHHE